MKQYISSLLFLAFALCSCQKMTFEENEFPNESGTITMSFKLGGFSMSSFEEMQSDGSSESRAATNQNNYTDNLLLGIYDMDGNLVDNIQYQNKTENTDDYGTFSHTLQYGKYTILAIGWNGTQECEVHSLDNITFNEGWVPNTFLCRQNIVVSESYSDTRTLILKRCVARFKMILKDKSIPKELNKFVVSFSGAGNTLNSETRHCVNATDFSKTISVNIDPSRITDISTYCFLPEDSTSININVTAYDADNSVIADRTFNNVPMQINYSTNYSGIYFPMDEISGSIDFDTEFEGEINSNF